MQYIFKGAFTQAFTSDAILLDHTPLRPVEALRGRAATWICHEDYSKNVIFCEIQPNSNSNKETDFYLKVPYKYLYPIELKYET